MSSSSPSTTQVAEDLGEIQAAAPSDVSPDDALRALMGLACRVLQSHTTLLWFAEAEAPLLVDASGQAVPASENDISLFDALCSRVHAQDPPLAIADSRTASLPEGLQATLDGAAFSCLGLPLKTTEAAPVGALLCFDAAPRQWSAADRAALNDLAGVVRTQVGTVRTLQQRYEEVAQAHASKHALLDATSEGIYGLDLHGNCVFSNKACARLLGYENPEVLLGENMHTLLHHTRADGTPYPMEACTIYQAFQERRSVHVPKDIFWRKDGTSFPAEFWSDPIFRDGEVVGAAVTFIDITERLKAQEALQEAEVRYRFLANTIPQQVWTARPDGQLEYVNQVVLEYFGRSFEEMIGEGWLDVLHPDDVAHCIERWTHSLQTGDPYEFEFRLLHRDGHYRWHLARARPQRDADGGIVHWFGSNTDIHDYLEVQTALRRSEEQRRLALEASDLGTWDFDLLTGAIYMDDRCRAIAGVSADAALEYETALGLIHPEDRAYIDAAVKDATDPATPGHFKQDCRVVWPDGTMRWVSVRGQVYFAGDGPERIAVRFVGIMFDITERKRTEHLIQAQKEVLERIIHDEPLQQVMQLLVQAIETQSMDQVMASVLLLDDDGQHLRHAASNHLPEAYNRAIDGLAIGPAVGSCGTAAYRKETVIVSDTATDPRWEAFRELAEEHQLGACWSVPMLASDNSVLGTFAVYHRRPCMPRPEDLNLIHVMADTAAIAIERKRNQDALKELNATLEKRVMERTAEVRTLASELTRIEQRERKRISQLLHDHLQQRLYGLRIQLRDLDQVDATERARRLRKIDPLLRESIDITRTLSVELSPPVLNQEGLVAALEWLTEQMKEVHGLNVRLTVEGSRELEDQELGILLFQLVRELLFNIVKHAGVGEASVVLGQQPDHLLLTITDQGAGFDVSTAMRRRKTVGGTGLLTIHERLGLFGGTLQVESEIGQGTRMQIMLPRQTPPAAASEAPQPAAEGAGILIVDDSESMQQGYADLINAAAGLHICATAATAAAALDAVKQRVPDLAVVDVSLPDMSGLELVKQITTAHPALPVVMVSGHPDQMYRRYALNAGAREYIEKDKTQDALIETIQRLLA